MSLITSSKIDEAERKREKSMSKQEEINYKEAFAAWKDAERKRERTIGGLLFALEKEKQARIRSTQLDDALRQYNKHINKYIMEVRAQKQR